MVHIFIKYLLRLTVRMCIFVGDNSIVCDFQGWVRLSCWHEILRQFEGRFERFFERGR
jgi:membrane protein YqaA with SNARE-associated domain